MNVILNFAISADGKIGTSAGGASKFTSQQDLERLWEIRKSADAIIVGRGTLEADNMSMTIASQANPTRQPLRIIVSKKGSFDRKHKVFHSSGGDIHLLSTESKVTTPFPEGVSVHHMPLKDFLSYCEEILQINHLLCEGGGQLTQALAKLGLITTIHLTLAGHTLIGGSSAPGILGILEEHLEHSLHFNLTHFSPLENGECFLTYSSSKSSA